MNFIAVAQALHMRPLIVAASLAVDSALGIVYFPLAASLTPQGDTTESESERPLKEAKEVAKLLGRGPWSWRTMPRPGLF